MLIAVFINEMVILHKSVYLLLLLLLLERHRCLKPGPREQTCKSILGNKTSMFRLFCVRADLTFMKTVYPIYSYPVLDLA